jgi:membrane-bound ClpP family serine protease
MDDGLRTKNHGQRATDNGLIRFVAALLCGWVLVAGSSAAFGAEAEKQKPAADAAEKAPEEADKVPADDAQPAAEAPAAEKRLGRFIPIQAPLNDKLDRRVRDSVRATIEKAKSEGRRPVFVFEIHSGKTEIGQALDLARFIASDELNGATTIAYLPETVTGHNVLVAMACHEIIMSEDADIGEAGKYETVIEPWVRDAYRQIANGRKTVPEAIALAMLDPAVEVVMVETDASREFVLADKLAELRKKRSFRTWKVVKPAGKPGLFSGRQGRELGFVSYLAANRQAVADIWKLPREALVDDPALAGNWRAVRCYVKGPITSQLTSQLQTMLQDEIRQRDVNFICVWLDSPGGSPADSLNLANYLAGLDSNKRRTVAYIPVEARGDAAFIAFACDQIVMLPTALLGGPGAAPLEGDDLRFAATGLEEIARAKFRSPALARAMVDPGVTVFRCVRIKDGAINYWTEAELAAQPDADQWHKEKQITTPGQPLRLSGSEADELGVATDVVDNFADFKSLYGLENDPQLIEPGWATALIDVLNSPGVSWLLLFIGLAALYAELHAPGIGVGGIVGALCFMLYFWSAYLGGTAGWLEILLFLAGIICLLLEFMVFPGFTIFGITGGLLVVGSLLLASQTFVLPHNEYQAEQLIRSLKVIVAAGAATIAAAVLINRYLPHAPMFNRMLLAPPSGEELSDIARREALAEFEHLLGATGIAATPLLPGGKAIFGDQLVDVIADGEVIERGQAVVVVRARGNRVLVRAAG